MYLDSLFENHNHKHQSDIDVYCEAYKEFLEENIEILDEAYYGKTKELLSIEKKIGEIRQKYRYDPMKFNTSKEKEELEDLFCDAFGFTCCSFHISPSNGFNAYTIPICNSVFDFRDFRKYIVSSGKGIKYTKDANIYLIMNVTKGLMFSPSFTDGEITAVCLHEIGHNFQTAMSGSMRSLHTVEKVFNLFLSPLIIMLSPQAGPFRNAFTDLVKHLDKDKSSLMDTYYNIKGFVTDIFEYGYSMLRVISNFTSLINPIASFVKIPEKILNKLNLNSLFIPVGIRGEAISDNFASSYGYGIELSDYLRKSSKLSGGMVSDQIFRDIEYINIYFDLIMMPNKVISNIFDPHPNMIARINNQYEYLYKELIKNENNPKMKKELERQLKELKKCMNTFVDAEEKEFFFSNRYDKGLLMLCGGDIRNGFAKDIDKDFDEAQDRAERQLIELKKKR